MGYTTSCPNCGAPLELRLGNPDQAPWVCLLPQGCGLGFWRAELGQLGRQQWHPQSRSFQHHPDLIGQREQEIGTGAAFGYNIRPSEVASLDAASIQYVMNQLQVPTANQPAVIGILRQMESGQLTSQQVLGQCTALGLPALGERLAAALQQVQA